MGILRQRQQKAGARSRAEIRKQQTKQSTRDTMYRRTTEDAKGGGDQSDRLCLQKGYLDVRFLVGKQTSASATFNLARSLKSFIIAGRQFDANFYLLPLYGDGNPLNRPQDVPNSKDAITVYYRHRLAGNNVPGKNENSVVEYDRAAETRNVDFQGIFDERSGTY
jgi:hypothetical protein